MKFKNNALAVMAAAAMIAGSAQANPFDSGIAGAISSLNIYSFNYNPGASSSAQVNFVLEGFKTVDGNNSYEDQFSFTVNGTQVFLGTFNLGGGGNSVYSTPVGASIVVAGPGDGVIGGAGGTVTFSFSSLALNSNTNNTFNFVYNPVGSSNAGGQGTGDESWKVSGSITNAVPEPETYTMLLAGLGIMGAVARSRKVAAK
jgi:hypothetical protein